MRNRTMSLLLALALTMSAILPLHSLAAQEEPLVLQTVSDGYSDISYRYYKDGTLAMKSDGSDATVYTYWPDGTVASEKSYVDRKLCSETRYDQQGNMVLTREITDEGVSRTQVGVAEYDDYGRLISHTVTGWYDEKGNLEEEYTVDSYTVTYADTNSDEPVTLTFGAYEQDGNSKNGPEPIEWQVLHTDGNRMLLLSKYALDSRAYHSQNTTVRWEDSDLRKWLNDTFLNTAFSASEQGKLQQKTTERGCTDQVFLLSRQEAETYLSPEEARLCQATEYAVKRGAYVNKTTGGSWWYLRTSAQPKATVMSVNSDGSIDYDGGTVTSAKGTVRPAIWVSVQDMQGHFQLLETVRREEEYNHTSTLPYFTDVELTQYREGSLYREFWQQWVNQYGNIMQMEAKEEATNIYDSYGNLTYNYYRDIKGAKDNIYEYSYENTYNDGDQLISQAVTMDGTDTWIYQYKYDQAGRMISEFSTDSEDASFVVVDNEWRYDKNGNLLSYSEKGELLEEYTYDDNGNLLLKLMIGKKAEEFYNEHHSNIPYANRQEEIRVEHIYVPLSQALWDGEL